MLNCRIKGYGLLLLLFSMQVCTASPLCMTRVMNASARSIIFFAKAEKTENLLGVNDGKAAFPWVENKKVCLHNDPLIAIYIDDQNTKHYYKSKQNYTNLTYLNGKVATATFPEDFDPYTPWETLSIALVKMAALFY